MCEHELDEKKLRAIMFKILSIESKYSRTKGKSEQYVKDQIKNEIVKIVDGD